ncbi:hypothetical protein ABE67_18775 [Cytobacillus firmus]|uniref:acetoacetate decarboxylase family protein n=1 Tax=Cytobacillus firmus TaxID=1399 RepID=UPI0018CD8558|nr:acetoacetate decarboxylase family protein [Cytobacillus firmus]MBG9451278.1 hypothetical protein [Cytobacillus firmus]
MNNAPLHAPLYPSPFVPYECLEQKSLAVYFRPNRKILEEWVRTTPYKLEEEIAAVVATDFSSCDKLDFMDFSIIVPVSYEGKKGGWYVFEYENNDAAIAAGRELWGYPKKYASITLEEQGDRIIGKAQRKDGLLIEIAGEWEEEHDLGEITLTPHFNIRTIPNPDKPGVWKHQLIERNTAPDFKLLRRKTMKGSIKIEGTTENPVHLLDTGDVLGACFTEGDFFATEKNGWGKVIKEW